MITLPRILTAAALTIGLFAGMVFVMETLHKHQGTVQEGQAIQHVQESEHHAGAAQAISDHSQALAEAQARVDRAQQEVAKLRRQLAARPRPGVPDPPSQDPAPMQPVADPDRDQLLVAQDNLIGSLKTQVSGLQVALADEQKRSHEWESAFQSERKARQAQEAATEAWKKAVNESRWVGRAQGFAAGVALGYLGGRL